MKRTLAGVILITTAVVSIMTASPTEARRFGLDWLTLTGAGDGDTVAKGLGMQSNGKYVLGGYSEVRTNYRALALARYNNDGSLDTTFGDGGIVIEDLNIDDELGLAEGFDELSVEINSLAIDALDKIVVVGSITVYWGSGGGPTEQFGLVARFLPDGEVDATFGYHGYRRAIFSGEDVEFSTVAIEPGGEIVAAGSKFFGGSYSPAIIRLDSSGNPDLTFDGDGLLTYPVGTETERVTKILIDPDGNIVVVGFARSSLTRVMAVSRLTASGALDLSFNTDGELLVNFGHEAYVTSAVLQSSGRVVLIGGIENIPISRTLALVGIAPDGQLDPDFGDNGISIQDLGGLELLAWAATIDDQDRIVVAGDSRSSPVSDYDFLVSRFEPNGALDTSFNNTGEMIFEASPEEDTLLAVLLNGDHVIAAGASFIDSDLHMAIAQLTPRVSRSPQRSVSLDPNGGSCEAGGRHTAPWTIRFRGTSSIPGPSECTRDGYVFGGWANADTPDTIRDLPLVDDPETGTKRYQVSRNAQLIAIWHALPQPPTFFAGSTRFFCRDCTGVWLMWQDPTDNATPIVTDSNGREVCTFGVARFAGWNLCNVPEPSSGSHEFRVFARNQYGDSPPLSVTLTFPN